MGEQQEEILTAQQSLGVSLTLLKVQFGSPAGMGQLIKYFESQSRRLDRQTVRLQPASFNSEFESLIKFSGVPILPPAITSSRRDELFQYKKDAVLLEKRKSARQRRQHLLPKGDSHAVQMLGNLPESGIRPTARQLNFELGGRDGNLGSNIFQEKLGATDSLSTFATAETGMVSDDFGLQTMDSVGSDFMTLDEGSIPKLFNGLVLSSFKEQKISYDLDRLSKALNVQELTSTSGSDLSDSLTNTQVLNAEDVQRAHHLAKKFLAQSGADTGDGQSASFFHESQDTVVEVSPEPGDNSNTSGYVDNTVSSNMEHTHNSPSSSPGYGSANTSATTDSQRSSRSSPKSSKGGVHFSSFVTEYNTNSSQVFERPTMLKKKLVHEHIHINTDGGFEGGTVVPIIGKPGETRVKHVSSHKVTDVTGASDMLTRVSLHQDSDSSPNTPPFHTASSIPFQHYGKSDAHGSDKENDRMGLGHDTSQGHKKSEHWHRERRHCDENPEHLGTQQLKTIGLDSYNIIPDSRVRITSQIKGSSSVACQGINTTALQPSVVGSVPGARDAPCFPDAAGAGHVTSSSESLQPPIPQAVKAAIHGSLSVSDSQASDQSKALTSGSDSSTIHGDLSGHGSVNLAMNITVAVDTAGHCKPTLKQIPDPVMVHSDEVVKDEADERSHSPKKLNNASDVKEDSDVNTPSRFLIRRGSYTLSEPSPALLRVRSKLGVDSEAKNTKQQGKIHTITDNSKSGVLGTQLPPANTELEQGKNTTSFPSQSTTTSVPSQSESEGKAEHINKYLNQVQFQNSMNFSWEAPHHDVLDDEEGDADTNSSVLEVLKSIAESQGSLEQVTVEELLSLHEQQMELKRQDLIKQQQRDMEELFVQQRREVMLLESEIQAAQQQEREQHDFLFQNAPENIKVKARNHDGEFSPEQSGAYTSHGDLKHAKEDHPNKVTHVSDGRVHYSSLHLPTDASSLPHPQAQPKSYPEDRNREKHRQNTGVSHLKSDQSKRKKVDKSNDESQTQVKTVADGSDAPSPRSPAGLISKIPEFSPSSSSPRIHRPLVLRSPLKNIWLSRQEGKVVVPSEALLPELQAKFARVSAVAKGFLTRCLLRSDKVQELIKTIHDTREFAFNFQTETPIKKGVFTSQDRALLERIIAQLQAALLDIHEIFFEIPCCERMALIEQTRMKEYEKAMKASQDSARGSGPRISQATLKALERKRKAREAESTVNMNSSRPKTAPSSISTHARPHNQTDFSGPLRRHFGFLINRALKPLQGQSHSQVPPLSQRSEKDRPRTAPEKQLTKPKRITAPFIKPALSTTTLIETNKDLNKDAVAHQGTNNKAVTKNKVAISKQSSSKSGKSWR
ncbi:unnamed protein product [Lymnaea stagnalis]|uniref:Centriolar coiled-coil protein of 110 kDa n=1 Tax=Lymnaea stagnalis TaxID=6523 RepID=A0AAV2I520_LYMST